MITVYRPIVRDDRVYFEDSPVELNELDETCEFEVIIKVGEQL